MQSYYLSDRDMTVHAHSYEDLLIQIKDMNSETKNMNLKEYTDFAREMLLVYANLKLDEAAPEDIVKYWIEHKIVIPKG